jgi:hypothetical protein
VRITPLTKSRSEDWTYSILNASLSKRGYAVQASVRLQDVLTPEPADYLDGYEEVIFHRQSHFDFVICRKEGNYFLFPVFAVEFDGSQHDNDETQIRRDQLKNRFCRDADFPLLRITTEQIELQERISVLEYMLELYLEWQRRGQALIDDCLARAHEWLEEDPGERGKLLDEWGLDPSSDPGFIFALEHPYPAVKTVCARLHKAQIRTSMLPVEQARPKSGTFYAVEEFPIQMGGTSQGADRYCFTSRAYVCLERFPVNIRFSSEIGVHGEPEQNLKVLYEVEKQAALKWIGRTGTTDPLGRPFADMIFLDLPGVSIPNVAENLAQYLCLRDIEQWCSENLSAAKSRR